MHSRTIDYVFVSIMVLLFCNFINHRLICDVHFLYFSSLVETLIFWKGYMPSTLSVCKLIDIMGVSELSSYEIDLRNQLMQNDVTLQVTNSKDFIEVLLLSY